MHFIIIILIVLISIFNKIHEQRCSFSAPPQKNKFLLDASNCFAYIFKINSNYYLKTPSVLSIRQQHDKPFNENRMRYANFDQVRTQGKPLGMSESGMGAMFNLITSDAGIVPGPQAFLFTSEPFSVSSAHFHIENQCQLVVSESGALGRQEVAPITVHDAQRGVGYRPFIRTKG